MRLDYKIIKTESGWEKEHRVLMQRHLGRALLSSEDVHHINGEHRDNRIENLQILSRAEHMRIHRKNEVADGTWVLRDTPRRRRNHSLARRRTSQSQIVRIFGLRKVGLTFQKIGDIVGCSMQQAHKIFNRKRCVYA